MSTHPATASAPRLRRALSLWDLILYGIIVIQPTAPMSIFGVLSEEECAALSSILATLRGRLEEWTPPR